jgi:transglutaminase-like putative cysteine protease
MSGQMWRLLDLALWVTAAAVAASRYALAPAVWAAVLGAAAGVFAGRALARSRARSASLLLGAVAVAPPLLLVSALLARSPGFAGAIGPKAAYAFAELLPWLGLTFSTVALLTALSQRFAFLRALELAAAASVYAALFAAHREGFVNRPFFLVDPLWGSGRDPLDYFLLLGVGLAALMAVALAKGAPGKRSLAGLFVLLCALLALFFMLPQGQLKNIVELHRVLGKDGKPDKGDKGKEPARPEDAGRKEGGERGGQGAKGEGEGGGDKSDLPDTFEDQGGKSNSPVAVVVFHNDFTPPLGYYYLRETAFSAYNGVRLVADASGKMDRDLPTAFAPGRTKVPSAGLPHGSKHLEAAPGDSFTRVATTVALLSPHPKPFALVNPAELAPEANPDPRRFFRAYGVLSWALTAPPQALLAEEAGGAEWDDAAWRYYTEAPSDPRYAQLVETIVATLPENLRDKPFARAVAVKLWLDKSSTYSMHTTHDGGKDPVADFLFGDLTGHCVHFAHAACLLYRTAGVPARVAAGYAVRADYRGGGAALMVRSRDAHAWPEVCLKGPGWIPLDISPAKNLDPPEEAPDAGLQQMLGDMAMGQRPPPPVPEEERRTNWAALFKTLLRVLGWTLLVLSALALLAGYVAKGWRRLAPFWGAASRRPVTAYRAGLDLLGEAGWRRAYGQTRESFARDAGSLCPAFVRLTALHLRRALGPPDTPPEPEACLDHYRALRAQLNRAPRRGRRLLGALDPFSWLRTR